MRPIHALILVAVLATCVAGLAFFLANDGGGARIADPANGAPSSGVGTSAPSANLATPDEALQHPDGRGGSSGTRSTVANPEAPRVRFDLTGRLVDARGRPVAGAAIYAAPGGSEELPIDLELGEAGSFLQRVGARSGADGRFSIQPPSKAQVRLAARAAGFAPFEQTIPLAGGSKDLGDVVLEDSAILEGRVVDGGHRGVAGARLFRLREQPGGLFTLGGPTGVLVATADAQGRFRIDQLAAGPWKLRIESEEHPDQQESGSTERPGVVVANLEFVLEDGFEIQGRVTGAPAALLPKLFVRATPRPGGEAGGFSEMLEAPELFGANRKAKLANDGAFTLRGLKKGQSYRLVARDSDQDFLGQARTAPVQAVAGDTGVLLAYRAETALVFQVVDAVDGKPIEDLTVSAGFGFVIPAMNERGEPLRHFPGGRVRFANFAGRPPSDAKGELRIEATGYRSYSRDDLVLVDGQDTDLGVLRLERAPLVRVEVVDARTGEPIAGAQVGMTEIEPERGGGMRVERSISIGLASPGGAEDSTGPIPGSTSARTDKSGKAQLTSQPGKNVQLRVTHREHAPWQSDPIVLPEDGDHDVRVRLGSGGSVEVRVVDTHERPAPGLAIDHRGAGDGLGFLLLSGAQDEHTDAQGVALFEHLMPGTHRFRVGERGGDGMFFGTGGAVRMATSISGDDEAPGWSEVTVVDGETVVVNLVAPERSTVTGRVTEAGRPLAGARVELVSAQEEEGEGFAMNLFGGGPGDQTDTKGEFRVNDVKVGRYHVEITHSSRAMPWSGDLEVRSGENRFDVDLPVAILEGTVTGPDKKPLAGVRIQAERAPDDAPGGRSVQRRVMTVIATDEGDGAEIAMGGAPAGPTVLTDAEGRYKLRGVVPDVELVVKAKAPNVQPGQSERVRVAADQTKGHVDIQLETGGAIEATLVRPTGTPASSCMVMATYEGTGNVEPRHEFSGAKGVVQLSGLKPGRWRVHVDSFAAAPGSSERASIPDQTLEVQVGQTARARFEVP